VITAVYNGEKHVEQAIRSVLEQTYPNIEYIVIDGASTDGTLSIIRRHEQRIGHWISRSDRGMYFAMNEGIARARGELIGIINSDDWYEPRAVEIAVREYEASGRQAVIYGLTRYYDEAGLEMILSYDHSRLPGRMINHPTCFVPKSLYTRFGAFDTRYRVAADYDLILRLLKAQVPFRHVEEIIANFRHGGFSTMHSSTVEGLQIQREHGFLDQGAYLRGLAAHLVRRMLPRRR
jgi:glycosyltransferase involved in cell wall biosynthesis